MNIYLFVLRMCNCGFALISVICFGMSLFCCCWCYWYFVCLLLHFALLVFVFGLFVLSFYYFLFKLPAWFFVFTHKRYNRNANDQIAKGIVENRLRKKKQITMANLKFYLNTKKISLSADVASHNRQLNVLFKYQKDSPFCWRSKSLSAEAGPRSAF